MSFLFALLICLSTHSYAANYVFDYQVDLEKVLTPGGELVGLKGKFKFQLVLSPITPKLLKAEFVPGRTECLGGFVAPSHPDDDGCIGGWNITAWDLKSQIQVAQYKYKITNLVTGAVEETPLQPVYFESVSEKRFEGQNKPVAYPNESLTFVVFDRSLFGPGYSNYFQTFNVNGKKVSYYLQQSPWRKYTTKFTFAADQSAVEGSLGQAKEVVAKSFDTTTLKTFMSMSAHTGDSVLDHIVIARDDNGYANRLIVD